jgi:hypothetical protein
MFVTISPHPGVTDAEIQAFDEKWMTDGQRQIDLDFAEDSLSTYAWSDPWGVGGELMAAMVRMYELTRRRVYLDHLYDLSVIALDYRDDGGKKPAVEDRFRGRVMPAWGEEVPNQGDLHWAGADIAGLYSYPIAAFARFVAEDSDLRAKVRKPDVISGNEDVLSGHTAVTYGQEAVRFAKATLETLRAYVDDFQVRPDGSATFVAPRSCKTLLTPARCEQAYKNARIPIDQNPYLKVEERNSAIKRLQQMQKNCVNLGKCGGYPLAHNQTHALVMAMIEEWRALESPYLREQIGHNDLANWARGAFPGIIKDTHSRFRLRPKKDGNGRSWLSWHYADDIPTDIDTRTEDTSHGGFSMRYIGVLHRNIERINAALSSTGIEPIDLISLRRGLADTFVLRIGVGQDLKHNVDGEVDSGRPADFRNGSPCAGWLDLAAVDDRIYYKCRDISLRVMPPDENSNVPYQKYLGVGVHASLLANKPRDRALGGSLPPEPHPPR